MQDNTAYKAQFKGNTCHHLAAASSVSDEACQTNEKQNTYKYKD